jgi:nucleolar protein 16
METDEIALENLSATIQPVKRHTSTSEKEWLRLLVQKHAGDYERMARDKSLNVWQKTPGEIKRMVKKAGGVEKLA